MLQGQTVASQQTVQSPARPSLPPQLAGMRPETCLNQQTLNRAQHRVASKGPGSDFVVQNPKVLRESRHPRAGSCPGAPGRTSCGRRPSPSGRAASTAGCIAPCALCWARPSCWPSALRNIASSCSCHNRQQGKSVPVSDRGGPGQRPPYLHSLGRGPSSARLPSCLPAHSPPLNPRAALTEVAWWVAHQTCP